MPRTVALFLSLFAISLFGSPLPVTNNARVAPAALSQGYPLVASNGFDFMAAWLTNVDATRTVLYITRIGSDGSVQPDVAVPLDPPLAFWPPDHETHPRGPSLTAARDGYFLSWISDEGLNTAILDSFGVVANRKAFPGVTGATLSAWNGSVHLVLSGFNGPFSATLLDDNGGVIARDIPVGDTHGDIAVRTAVTADDNGFLVVSTKSRDGGQDIYGRRITTTGAAGDWVLLRSVIDVPTGVAVVFDGTRDIVVWSDALGLWTMPVDTHTTVASPARQVTSGRANLANAMWDDGRLWITYDNNLITIAADGTAGAPAEISDFYPATLAANSSRVLTVRLKWSPLTQYDVVGRFIGSDSEFTVARSRTTQQDGQLATEGDRLMAVWSETTPPTQQVFASLIDRAHPAAPREVQLSSSDLNVEPAVAFNGSQYLVAWTHSVGTWETRHVYTRRLSADGEPLDAREIDLGPGTAPHLASNGKEWLLVYSLPTLSLCGNQPGTGMRLNAIRIDADGNVLDRRAVRIAPQSGYNQQASDVVWSGSEYVVAWQERCSGWHILSTSAVAASAISPDLERITTNMLTGHVGTIFGDAKVAAVPGRILIAWPDIQGNAPRTDYRLITGGLLPASGRVRAVGAHTPSAAPSIDAQFIGVSSEPDGRLFILTSVDVPTVNYRTLNRWNVTPEGATNSGYSMALFGEHRFTGDIVRAGGRWWIAESYFSTAAGAYRQYFDDVWW